MNLNELGVGRLDELPDREGKILLTEVAKVYGEIAGFDAQAWIDDPDKKKWEAVYLDPSGEGHGMSDMDTFRCLVDFPRTLKLMRGIAREVEEIRTERKDIVAIDAGTGTGILAITMALAGCSRVYALEINERSAALAEAMVKEFGLEKIVEVIRCDATKVAIPESAHILTSENLANGLLDEPQYEIIYHLSGFLAPEARIIPNRAVLMASLARVDWSGVDRKWEIAKRKLDPKDLRSKQVFATVDSRCGTHIKRVVGQVDLVWSERELANALVISTDFVIDGEGRNVLEADEADFLGASTAFLIDEVGGVVNVDFDYRTGVRCDNVKVKLNGGRIKFSTK